MRAQLVALERWAFRVTSCCDDVVAKRSYNDLRILCMRLRPRVQTNSDIRGCVHNVPGCIQMPAAAWHSLPRGPMCGFAGALWVAAPCVGPCERVSSEWLCRAGAEPSSHISPQVVLADLILLQTVRDAVGMLLFCSGAHDHRHVYDSREALLTIAHQEHPQCGA